MKLTLGGVGGRGRVRGKVREAWKLTYESPVHLQTAEGPVKAEQPWAEKTNNSFK